MTLHAPRPRVVSHPWRDGGALSIAPLVAACAAVGIAGRPADERPHRITRGRITRGRVGAFLQS